MTKNKFFKIIIISIIFAFCFSYCIAYAANFTIESFFEEEKLKFVEKLDLKLIDKPVNDIEFCGFDVSYEGNYLIAFVDYKGNGFNTQSVGRISVYNSDSNFLYGYIFNTSGAIEALWNGENISIFFHKEDSVVIVDANGDIINGGIIANTQDNKNFIQNELGFKTKIVDGINYTAKTGKALIDKHESLLSGRYSTLVKTDESGQRTVLYEKMENKDSNEHFRVFIIVIFIIAFIIGISIVLIAIVAILKSSKNKR